MVGVAPPALDPPEPSSAGRFAAECGLDRSQLELLDRQLAHVGATEPTLLRIRPLSLAGRLDAGLGVERGGPGDVVMARALRGVPASCLHTPLDLRRPSPADRRPVGPRVIVASTPRAGNSILRLMIEQFGYRSTAVHDCADLDWRALPARSVVQVHATPGAVAELVPDADSVKVVTLVRHPVDVLISIQRFAVRSPECRYWLGGTALPEPESLSDPDAFLAWATGPGAAALLQLSVDWAARPDVCVVRYESLVASPGRQLNRLAGHLGERRLTGARRRMRTKTASLPTAHITHGGPGAHRGLPAEQFDLLVNAHRDIVEALGYTPTAEHPGGRRWIIRHRPRGR